MPTVDQINQAGTTLVMIPRPIYEPISAPTPLSSQLSRFGSQYDLSTNSNLYRFLIGLCGESGAGSIKKDALYPKLQTTLEGTHFTDLDKLFGSPLGLPRLPEEIYTYDPRNEALTQGQWADVRTKDSSYRSRCLTWMRAIIDGPTKNGIRLAAEAAIGIECDVFERYKYIENLASDNPITVSDIGQTNSRNEFVVIPQIPTITQLQRRRIIQLIDRLRPMNTLPTVVSGALTRSPRTANAVYSTSDSFYIQKLVTGSGSIDWPSTDPSQGIWITTQQEEAPTFAFMDSVESTTYLTVVSATASTEQVGPFNQTQRALFGNLNRDVSEYYVFSENQSYAKTFAPIQLSVPWTSSR